MKSLEKHTAELLPELEKWAEQSSTLFEERLFLQAYQHVKNGYKDIWNTLEDKNGIRNTESQYNTLSEAIPKQIETTIKTAVETANKKRVLEKLAKLEIENMEWFVIDIKEFMRKRLFENKHHTFQVVSDNSQYSIRSVTANGEISRTYNQRGTKENLQEICDIMNSIQKDVDLEEMTKTLVKLGHQLYDLRITFKRKINLVVNNIKYAVSDEDKILLEKCDWCQALKKKWKIS